MRPGTVLRAPDADRGDGGAGGGSGEELITISRAELEDLQARAGASASAAARLDDARSEWAAALQARDAEHARSVAAAEGRSAALERSYKAALLDRELAAALAGRPLVPGAADQLIRLWRDAFEVVEADGAIRVVSREGRGVEQAVADRLAGPEFAHFCLPSSRGGTGARGQARSATPPAAPASPRTLGEAVIHQWRESAASAAAAPGSPGWGRRR